MMGTLSAIAFAFPHALWALMLLPLIWWLLRFTPPRPETVRFPPFRFLLELTNREEDARHTPWWLILIRLALAAAIARLHGGALTLHANRPGLRVTIDLPQQQIVQSLGH